MSLITLGLGIGTPDPNDLHTELRDLIIAVKAKTDVIPINPLLTDDVRVDNLDATVSSRSTKADVFNASQV